MHVLKHSDLASSITEFLLWKLQGVIETL